MQSWKMTGWPLGWSGWLILSLWVGMVTAEDDRLDAIMYQDPTLPLPTERFALDPALKVPWLAALRHSDSELQRTAADIISVAHRYGLTDWADTTGRLVEILQAEHQDRTVRRAAAHALVVLDVQQAAEVLSQAGEANLDVAQIIEPALARWDYQPFRDRWLARLDDPDAEPLRLLLAIESLGLVREPRALEKLLRRVHDQNELAPTRLASARAAANIDRQNLVEPARTLAASPQTLPRLLAATLLQHHQDAAAVSLLQTLAQDEAPTVAGAALLTLYHLDPALIYDLAGAAIRRNDVNIRELGARAFVSKADQTSMRELASLLGDHNPKLRRYVAEALTKFGADPELTEVVREVSVQTLASDDWRALEQSAIILGALDHELAGPRFVELLNHRRPEVQSASAWALRRLHIPELFPAMLQHAQEQFDKVAVNDGANYSADFQISQIMQTFGVAGYREAEPLMRKLVPKSWNQHGEARPGGIWSLGYFYEKQAPSDLAPLLADRLADDSSLTPERSELRAICAVSLGRMRAESALPVLRKFANGRELVAQACRWAIEQITGEKAVTPPQQVWGNYNWFLTPKG